MREEPIVNGRQVINAWNGMPIGNYIYDYMAEGNIAITNRYGEIQGVYRTNNVSKPYTTTRNGQYVGEGNLLMGLLYEDIHKRNLPFEIDAIKHY